MSPPSPSPPPRVALVWDERCLAHRNPVELSDGTPVPAWVGVQAWERPERMRAILDVLAGAGVLDAMRRLPAREATEDELRSVHTDAYVEEILRLGAAADADQRPRRVGEDSYVGPGSATAARLAVGGLLEAVTAVTGGAAGQAYVLARPPGHHATADTAMGFCLFNAVAVAAHQASAVHGAARVAIVDLDVHHGNGTEDLTRDDPGVLLVDVHQDDLYPRGRGGLGVPGVVNVPLPDGCGDDAYAAALDRVVVPALRRFAPDLVLVSAGADAAAADPLGRMAVTGPGFRRLADTLVAAADELCGGRLVLFSEGGYHLAHTAVAMLSFVEALLRRPPTFPEDPVGCDVPDGIGAAAETAIEAAAAAAGLAAV